MCSTTRQRFFLAPEENRVQKANKSWRTHMLIIALNYAGSEAPLGCTIDGDRLQQVAEKAGVKDIVKLYDDGSTPGHPCAAEVREAIKDIAARCTSKDFFVLVYSGHGMSVENAEAPTGTDTALCLTQRDGTDDYLIDEELAEAITNALDPGVRVLVLADACHSQGVLDCDTPGIWGARKVVALSGCQDTQCSTDTGDGGAMTNALLKCISRQTVKNMRKTRNVSVQYIFNRMVEFMPEDDEEDDDEDDDDSEEREWDDNDDDDDGDEGDDGWDEEDGEEEGQDITLSWPGGCDPSKIPFPF